MAPGGRGASRDSPAMLQEEEGQGDAAPTGLIRDAAAEPGQEPQPVKVRSPLPLHRKVCYAIGGAPYQLTGNALGFFLQIFLLDVVQLEPFHASLILFLGRAWDAVTDPAVGFLVSRSPRRRCGKLIPWIVASTPFGVFFYFLLWFVPSDSLSVSLKFLWYLAMYCLFQTCMSCYHVPYSSLTMFLGGDQRERDSATAYRMGVEVLSTLVGSGIQGQIVGSHHASMQKSCDAENGTLGNGTSLLTDTLENTRRSYLVAATVLGSLYCLSCLVLFFGVKEQQVHHLFLAGPLSPLGKASQPFFRCLRIILSHRSYVWLLCGFLCASLAFQLAQGIFAFFCTHAAGLPGTFQHLVLIMLVVACLSIPFWQWFLVKFGKKTAVFVGLSLIIPALIVITLVTHNFLVFAFMVALAGCSLSVLYLLPWSMLPDAVDDFRLRNPTCLNLEAFFYSFYVFFNKFAGGLSLGVSTMSLHFAGYSAKDCTHNPPVILTLRILMAPIPIALLLMSMAMFCSYPINEERRKEIRLEMEASG
ncbi:sodium-dependent lysophosphatidylcholine symporter 1-like [Heteronotia binoei]|uniref:sodium-dependent lysophosphatidylcholine symporter 1-like n=1 Tax=Heteronotia binoei TaxID=13085 RepID=UPI00292D9F39|nr:sodium-dependent lysophosphatidylcholine symporter 1-like [Heteronotia binoei]